MDFMPKSLQKRKRAMHGVHAHASLRKFNLHASHRCRHKHAQGLLLAMLKVDGLVLLAMLAMTSEPFCGLMLKVDGLVLLAMTSEPFCGLMLLVLLQLQVERR